MLPPALRQRECRKYPVPLRFALRLQRPIRSNTTLFPLKRKLDVNQLRERPVFTVSAIARSGSRPDRRRAPSTVSPSAMIGGRLLLADFPPIGNERGARSPGLAPTVDDARDTQARCIAEYPSAKVIPTARRATRQLRRDAIQSRFVPPGPGTVAGTISRVSSNVPEPCVQGQGSSLVKDEELPSPCFDRMAACDQEPCRARAPAATVSAAGVARDRAPQASHHKRTDTGYPKALVADRSKHQAAAVSQSQATRQR